MSLHTEYRPKTFEEVIGQKHVIASLEKVVKDNKAHTFLLTGPAGTGKTTIARILANLFAGGNSDASNIEEIDAAKHSGADDIRAVVSRTQYRALGKSPVRCIVVDECHKLSSAAWTILLKPTEEPPEHVYWIFCSTDPGKMPKANQTRCIRYDLKPVDETLIYSWLCEVADAEKLESSEEVLEAIAENCGGSPRQALVFLETCKYAETAADALRLMRSAGQSKEIIDLCRFLITERGRTWVAAVKLIKSMGDFEAESARIVICNYIAAVLLNTTNENKAQYLLRVLDCFRTPYQQSDKLAPLLLSVGLALGLDV